MTETLRTRIFFAAAMLFLVIFGLAAKNLPAWGEYRGPYGDAITSVVVYERHATDAVNAINYDFRGFDTLGEEFILFTAVVGIMMLLRREPGSPTTKGTVDDRPDVSKTVETATLPAAVAIVLFGFYIGLHGQLTPGGGFQAGVILASAPMLIYLSENTHAFRRLTSHSAVEMIEAIGAGFYALIGAVALLLGLPLLTNWLPLGKTGTPFSSGTIALISATVGVEVTAAFLLIIYSYLEEIVTGEVSES